MHRLCVMKKCYSSKNVHLKIFFSYSILIWKVIETALVKNSDGYDRSYLEPIKKKWKFKFVVWKIWNIPYRVHLCSNGAGYLRKYLTFLSKFAHTNSVNIQGRCQFFSRDSKTRAHTHIDKSSISRIYTTVDSYLLKYHKYTTKIYLKLCFPYGSVCKHKLHCLNFWHCIARIHHHPLVPCVCSERTW